MANLTPDGPSHVGMSREEALRRIEEAERNRPPSRCGGIIYRHDPPKKETTMDIGADQLTTIASNANWLRNTLNDEATRHRNAADAGAKLAAEVYRFTQDPEAVGTEALEAAYGEFMGQHAANFTTSAREAVEARV